MNIEAGSGCKLSLEPAGELALATKPRAAPGFAAADIGWKLAVRADGVPYAIDFTQGLLRLDGPSPRPVCGELAGARRIAFVDEHRAVIDRSNERLLDLATCTWSSQSLTPSPVDIAAVDGVLFGVYLGSVYRYPSLTEPGVVVDEPTTSPSRVASRLMPCNGAMCALDPNTPTIERYASSGALLETIRFKGDGGLMYVFAAAPDGSYWLARRGPLPRTDQETFVYSSDVACPIEVYRIPPAT